MTVCPFIGEMTKSASFRVARKDSSRVASDSEGSDEESEDIVEEEPVDEEYVKSVSIVRILGLNKPEWKQLVVGSIGAVVSGASLPAFAILFGEFYGVMSWPDEDEARRRGLYFSLLFLLLGLLTGLGTFYQTYMFNIAGVKLTSRLRSDVFKATMKQEMGWFDSPRNGVGILCARLAGDCASVQGVSCGFLK